jgi:hypothetical protein
VLGRLLIFLQPETFRVFLHGILLLNGSLILVKADCSEAEAGISQIEGLRSILVRPGVFFPLEANEKD